MYCRKNESQTNLHHRPVECDVLSQVVVLSIVVEVFVDQSVAHVVGQVGGRREVAVGHHLFRTGRDARRCHGGVCLEKWMSLWNGSGKSGCQILQSNLYFTLPSLNALTFHRPPTSAVVS